MDIVDDYTVVLCQIFVLNTKKKNYNENKRKSWLELSEKKIPPWLSSCAQVLSWPHFCDLNHVISVALIKATNGIFIPINTFKVMCCWCQGYMALVWILASPPQISFLFWEFTLKSCE